jgi:cysteine-rich repeat protein
MLRTLLLRSGLAAMLLAACSNDKQYCDRLLRCDDASVDAALALTSDVAPSLAGSVSTRDAATQETVEGKSSSGSDGGFSTAGSHSDASPQDGFDELDGSSRAQDSTSTDDEPPVDSGRAPSVDAGHTRAVEAGSVDAGLSDAARLDAGALDEPELSGCGDGVVQAIDGEKCDDGNVTAGDGCSSDCTRVEVLRIWAGLSTACAQVGTLGVKCWGRNQYGGLGNGNTENRGLDLADLGDELEFTLTGTVTEMALFDQTACAIKEGALLCWGNNGLGNLGAGDNRAQALLPVGISLPQQAKSVAIGLGHTCVVLETGEVKCWGEGYAGGLGLGSTDDLFAPSDASVALGAPAKTVHCTEYAACALMESGAVRCWGESVSGEAGVQGSFGANPDELNPPLLDLGDGFVPDQLVMGGYRACAKNENSDVKCWGNGVGEEPGEMGNALPLVDWGGPISHLWPATNAPCMSLDDGTLKCENKQGQVEVVPLGTGLTALEVASGYGFGCALLSDYTVVCWGDNNYGQLGTGAPADEVRGDEPSELGDALERVRLFD